MFRFVREWEGQFGVTALCRSGFYPWKGREKGERAQENERLLGKIRQFFVGSDQTYGSPRIWRDLREVGFSCGRNRVARLMRQAGMRATVAPRFVVTTGSRHALPVADNLLGQDFGAAGANVKWASDITCIRTSEGWLYLCVVSGLFSRKVVGWSMRPSLERSPVVDALQAALCQRRPEAGLMHHSDRGSPYASGDYQSSLRENGTVRSVSRKGDCYDDAVVESFFGTLKQESVNRRSFASREEARQAIFPYVEAWYNRRQRHSSRGYVSPAQFEGTARQRAMPA